MTIKPISYDDLWETIKTQQDYFNDVVRMAPDFITDEDRDEISREVCQLRQLEEQVQNFVQGRNSPFADFSELEVRAIEARFFEINALIDQHPILQVDIASFLWSSDSEEELNDFNGSKSLYGRVESFTFQPISPSSSPRSDSLENTALWGSQALLVKEVEALQDLISLLQNDSHNDFKKTLEKWQALGASNVPIYFQLTKGRPALIADRICYHLYCIHKHEQPGQLLPDSEYGKKAMKGIVPATNADRIRAAQRTLAEAILEGLEYALNFDEGEELQALLILLESLKLDPRDEIPSGDFTTELFETVVKLHFSNTGCPVSDMSGDLGQWAFYHGRLPFKTETKILAIQMIRQELGKAWKLL